MRQNWYHIATFLLKLFFMALLLSPFWDNAMGLNELFDLYSSPQTLSMGNAFTAEASGYLANFYNPAGIAKGQKRRTELNIIDITWIMNTNMLGSTFSAQSIGITKLLPKFQLAPNQYQFARFSSVPSVTVRGFSFSFLANYQIAGQSDGTNFDSYSGLDVGPVVGTAFNLYGKRLKIGFAAKAIARNMLIGTYAHNALTTDAALYSQMKSGLGIGGDIGMMFTFPYRFLPTFGFTWQNVMGLQFLPINILNSYSTSVPPTIPQSFNAGFSIKPNLGKGVQGTFTLDFQHIERMDLPFTQRFHVGAQIEFSKSILIWLGLNQLNICGGFAYRLPGGNLELGTSGNEIGTATTSLSDRRFFMRYTIGF